LFRIAEAELPDLDAYEGSNEGYVRRLVKVRDETGRFIAAQTYVATKVDPSLRPYTWYKRHVLEGAREANVPLEYVRTIEQVDAIDDCNGQRVSGELAIYG
jgi:gamma-glutamylcyclotransferase